ncbi:hypothetical protein Tco_0600271 [Tanacetum coccineum]|uniref:Gag-Pol polyprotein n=1 Tax=Tanacetum coccineum TaxID=301880 RepID=A0ABQ4WBB9_9ASTR
MSNSNTNLQTQSSNALHNAIMEAGSKDRPPMLAPGNYVQWKSRIKRYIDTKPNSELIHYCLQNPPYTYQWAEKTVPVAEGSSETTTERYMENYKNVSQDIRDQLNAEAEAVQIILTGIDNDIYSTVDACPNACEMWKAIERLKQGESINVQDLETNLYWEFGKFTSRDGESLESYYSRFYKMMNELVQNQCHSQELKTVSYHKLYDILKQHQNEVNEIRTWIEPTRTANPLPPSRTSPKTEENAIVTSLLLLISHQLRNLQTYHTTFELHQTPVRANQDKSPRINRGSGKDNQRAVNVAGARENVELEAHNMIQAQLQEQKPEINFLESSKQRELVDKLKGEIEDFKTKNKSLESSNNHFKEANNELSKTNQLMFKDLKKFQAELDKYNDVNYASKGCYNDNLALMLAPDSDETIRLEKERRSKLSDLIRPFDYDQLNNLYDLFVPQREKSPEQHYFPKTSKMSHTSSNKEFSKESFRKQTTLLEKRMDESIPWDQKCKSSKELFKIKKSVDTFLPKVDTLKSQLETQKTQFLNEIDRLSREYYYADHMNAILGVYTDLDEVTNLQCDYLETWEKCKHLEKELSKSRTMSKSFEALQKHAINLELDLQQLQTAMDVPINTREPKQNVNQSVATSSKKTVATDSTVKKFRNTTRKIYEQVSKTCSWWYPKYTPPGYNWKPKSQIGMLTKRSMPLGTPSRTANSLEHKNS